MGTRALLLMIAMLAGSSPSLAEDLNGARWVSAFHAGGARWAVEKVAFDNAKRNRPVHRVWIRADAVGGVQKIPYRRLYNVEYYCELSSMKMITSVVYETASSLSKRTDYPYSAIQPIEPETAFDMIFGIVCPASLSDATPIDTDIAQKFREWRAKDGK